MIYIIVALLTAIVETAFFWCCRYRNKKFLGYVFLVNILTNISVNLVFAKTYNIFPYNIYGLIFLLELAVFISEYVLLAIYLRKNSTLLAGQVFLANLITWGLGEISTQLFF